MILLPLGFLFFLLSYVFSGQLEFSPWSQVEHIYNNYYQRTFLDLIKEQYPHLTRYLLVYPAYLFSNSLKIDITRVYSIYVILNLFFTALLWNKIMILRKVNILENSFKTLLPLFLSFIINGRFSFAILGFAFLVLNIVKRDLNIKTYYFFDLLGIFLVTVTSGTALVGFLFFLLGNYKLLLKDINYYLSKSIFGIFAKNKIIDFIYIFLISFIVFFFLGLYIHRNVLFYGGYKFSTMSGLMSHGLGLLVINDQFIKECNLNLSNTLKCQVFSFLDSNIIFLLIIFLIVVAILLIFISVLQTPSFKSYSKKLIFISSFAGVFGFTAFFTIISVIPTISFNEIISFLKNKIYESHSPRKLKL